VVDNFAVTGPYFYGLDEPVFGETGRNDEVLILIRTPGFDCVFPIHRKHDIRFTDRPTVGVARRGRKICGIAFL